MSKIIAGEPSAWELRVRRADTEWLRYSIYEKYEHAARNIMNWKTKTEIDDGIDRARGDMK